MQHISLVIPLHYQDLIAKTLSHPRNTALTTFAIVICTSLTWVVSDFHAWKTFGTGGTPPTWAGYWRMTKFRVGRVLTFGTDDLASALPLSDEGTRYLTANDIPVRKGARPAIMSRTMPQRQVPYKSGTVEQSVKAAVTGMMAKFAREHPELLELRPSKTEGGTTDAIYAKPSLQTLNPRAKTDKVLMTEIAHAHPAEGSLHVWLSQADAKTVISKGWGLRFPLKFVDKGFIMVYAPRTMEEVKVVEWVVKAGISWITGVKV